MTGVPERRDLLLTTSFAVICALGSSTLVAQTVSFTQGPGRVIHEPTIASVFDPITGRNRLDATSVLAVDLRGNGRPDIVIFPGVDSHLPLATGPIRILRAADDGSLSDVTRAYFGGGVLPATAGPGTVIVGDFNRDGKPDFFVGESGVDVTPFLGSVNMLLESTTDGSYADRSSTLPAVSDFTHSATMADVDGDGNLDVYVGDLPNPNPAALAHLLMGKADGTFERVSSTLPTWLTDGTKSFTARFS